MKNILFLSATILLTACKMEVQTDKPEALAEALLQADRNFAALSEKSGPHEAFAAYLAENAMMLTRTGQPIVGYDNALSLFPENPTYQLLWQPQLAEVAKSGEMGWTWGTYQVIAEGSQVSNGKYVNIWLTDQQGQWKVRMDMGNQEPAQESPAAENSGM